MKKLSSFVVAGLAALAFLVAGPSAHADLLVNGGWEDPIDPGSDPLLGPQNWYAFVGPGAVGSGNSDANPRSGSMNGQSNIDNTPNSFTGMQQLVTGIVGGEDYTFSVWAASTDINGDPAALGVTPEFRMEFFDAANVQVGVSAGTINGVNETYQQFSVTGAAPGTATSVRAVVVAASFSGLTNGGLSWDDAELNGPQIIPEPATFGLLALGGLGLVARRRRS